jgi:hypothetical protein
LTEPNPPASLAEVRLRINVAGQQHETSLASAPNPGYSFLWDGKDDFGRSVNGVVGSEIFVRFRYPLVYSPLPAGASEILFNSVSFNTANRSSSTPPTTSCW